MFKNKMGRESKVHFLKFCVG